MVEISASLLSTKKDNIIKTIYNLETAKVDYFHIDVMDGEFVKNNTVDQMVEYCDYLSNITNVPLDIHLMVKDVKKYIDMFLPYNPNYITVHYEAFNNNDELIDIIDYIHNNNCRVGVAIKPNTDISNIYNILEIINMVLVMTVEPGMGGQELIKDTITKIENLSEYVANKGLDTIIEADGGINLANSAELKDKKTDIMVVGTALIESENYVDMVKSLKE